jgi:hypothetical protein
MKWSVELPHTVCPLVIQRTTRGRRSTLPGIGLWRLGAIVVTRSSAVTVLGELDDVRRAFADQAIAHRPCFGHGHILSSDSSARWTVNAIANMAFLDWPKNAKRSAPTICSCTGQRWLGVMLGRGRVICSRGGRPSQHFGYVEERSTPRIGIRRYLPPSPVTAVRRLRLRAGSRRSVIFVNCVQARVGLDHRVSGRPGVFDRPGLVVGAPARGARR